MPIRSCDVIVIGGGVAGLAASAEVGRQKVRVVLLEARDRLGGRIATIRGGGWPEPIELGAQFVHSGNDQLWDRMKAHDIATAPVPPRHWRLGQGGLEKIEDVAREIGRATNRIDAKRMKGWTFADFLRWEGRAIAERDRELAMGFVEGFEAAPMRQMSAVAVAGATLEDDEQFVVPRGYDRLVEGLKASVDQRYVTIATSAPCRRVEWHRGKVDVYAGAARFRAARLLVTVPLGVLQTKRPRRGAIEFRPRLREQERLVAGMGMGHVIRITLRFDHRAWRRLLPAELRAAAPRGFGFVHSRLERVPVWWSLTGDAVITGWSGGPNALAIAGRSACAIEQIALGELSRVFRVTKASLNAALVGAATHNWSRDPFSRGAYSFTRAGYDDAPAKLRRPIDDTIYFAGEATADGEEVGTVHGALSSGLRAANEVLRGLGP